MSDLLAARSQMAVSLAFHIVFAAIGIAMPLLMVIAEWRWLRTGERGYLTLAHRWARGTAILFAVGAVSGTVLSFELGLLWPGFMGYAGAVIGMPFSLEGFAFFTEAIFLGIYLYGWEKVPARAHLLSGVLVAVSGMLSGIFVVIANAWMNTPTGFTLVDGHPADIRPLAAMANPNALSQVLHMTLAAYAATGLAVAGLHALMLRKDPTSSFHRKACGIALSVAAVTGVLQPLSGDFLAKAVARNQPVKLAAFEGHFETSAGAPLVIGGFPDEEARTTRWAISVPYGLSILAYGSPGATVTGLNDVPRENWPPVAIVHVAFQVMVACGTVMALLGLWAAWRWWRRKREPWQASPRFLLALGLATPLGFLAIETGWVVTEVGRQPWIIYGIMRTSEAVTPMPGLIIPFLGFTVLYVLLAIMTWWLMRRQVLASPVGADDA